MIRDAGGVDARVARVAALDGIRGIAILLVIIHNAGSINSLAGVGLKLWAIVSNAGWVGVQLFFALSGFLITRILVDSRGAPGALQAFYVRRFLRIAPLYYAFLAFVFFAAPHIPILTGLAETGSRHQMWYWLYLSNWIAPFGETAVALPHVWSLAVEEQFYLVWPLLVAVASERALPRVCVALIVGALVIRVALHAILPAETASAAAYTFTVCRWDAIAFGALVALLLRDRERAARIRPHVFSALVATSVALLLVVAVRRGLDSRGLFSELVAQPLTGFFSALIVLVCVADGLAEVPVAGRGASIRRWLAQRWLTVIGKYSYAIYVFHLPVHFVMRPYAAAWLARGGGATQLLSIVVYTSAVFAVSMVLALASWRVLEQPMLSLKRYFPMPASR